MPIFDPHSRSLSQTLAAVAVFASFSAASLAEHVTGSTLDGMMLNGSISQSKISGYEEFKLKSKGISSQMVQFRQLTTNLLQGI